MNFALSHVAAPLKVLVINPLTPAAQMSIVKIMSGVVFGNEQLIDLILLVYSNEKPSAENYKMELYKCAFQCMNSIVVSSDLPGILEADVFCFITNFKNPNQIDVENVDDDQFDALYLIIKIANNLSWPDSTVKSKEETFTLKKGNVKEEQKRRKPILIADGLVAMDILKSLSKNLPSDIFFCSTPLPTIAKSVLGEYLKIPCNVINDVLVWGGNDEVFHIEVEKPIIIHDVVGKSSHCEWDAIGKELENLNLDHTQFNESWMKKEFIEKVLSSALKNPHDSIYRASEFAKTLRCIWKARSTADGNNFYCSMGVIIDGSLGTIKDCPYILPLVFKGEEWSVNTRYADTAHVRQEIKRINKVVVENHRKLISYCKKFLEDNVINQIFIPNAENESGSIYSIVEQSSVR